MPLEHAPSSPPRTPPSLTGRALRGLSVLGGWCLRRRGWFLPLAVLGVASVLLVPSSLNPSLLPCHRDLLDFVLPMKVHLARSVAGGHLPWWDPWTLGGHPFLANLQSQVFYPPNWLFLVFEPAWGLSLFLAAHLLWAGLGCTALSRSLGASRAAALLAGASFLAGGFLVSLQDLTNQLCTASWMPWACLAALRHGRVGAPRTLAAWAAAMSLSVLAAAPQYTALTAAVSTGFALVAAPGGSRVRRGLAGAALACTLAALLCAVQLGPFAELVARSDRVGGTPFHAGGRHALEAAGLQSLVVAPEHALAGPAGAYLRSLYLGPLVLLLAVMGVLRRDRWTVLLGALTLVGAALAASPSLPGGELLLRATPFLRYPIKYLAPAALAVPLLAARGLDLGLAAASRALLDQAEPPSSREGTGAWEHGGRPRAGGPAVELGRRGARPPAGGASSAPPLRPTGLRTAVGWLAALLVVGDLVLAHRVLALALPERDVLRETRAIELLSASTRACGPRVHAPPLSRTVLERRAARILSGDLSGAMHERVERLEGALPAMFEVHATWGGAALVERERDELLARAATRADPNVLAELEAGFLLVGSDADIPFPRIPVNGGSAAVHVVPGAGPFPERTWVGPNRAVGPPGLPPPSSHPGWHEDPPGTWTYRQRGLHALVAASLAGLGALVVMVRRRARA